MFNLQHSDKKILTYILQNKISRSQLAQKANISPSTITNITKKLISLNLCNTLGKDLNQKRGQPKIYLTVDNKIYCSIGIYFSPHNIYFTAIKLSGTIIQTTSLGVNGNNTYDVMQKIKTYLPIFLDNLDYKILAINILFSGNFHNKEIVFPASCFYNWKNFNLNKLTFIKNIINCPIYVANDVQSCAFYEFLYGIKQDNFINIGLLNGIGSSFFINGMFTGIYKGQIGHLFPTNKPRPSIADLQKYLSSQGSSTNINNYLLYEQFLQIPESDNKIIHNWAKNMRNSFNLILKSIALFLNTETIVINSYNKIFIQDYIVPQIIHNIDDLNLEPTNNFKIRASSLKNPLINSSAVPAILCELTNSVSEQCKTIMRIN